MLFYDGTINRLLLEVNITNNPLSPGSPAEDAHNPVLNVSIPALLIYAGVRTKVLKVRASGRRHRGAGTGLGPACDRTGTGPSFSQLLWSVFQGDMMERVECSVGGAVLLCELGNPFRSNQEVQNSAGPQTAASDCSTVCTVSVYYVYRVYCVYHVCVLCVLCVLWVPSVCTLCTIWAYCVCRCVYCVYHLCVPCVCFLFSGSGVDHLPAV